VYIDHLKMNMLLYFHLIIYYLWNII